jgi:spermidine/putrescine-binding protein
MKKVIIFLALVGLLFTSCSNEKTIRILCWAGYDETEIKEYIAKCVPDVKLEYVIYTGGEDMLRKYESNKKNFDLLIVDAEYGKILYDKGELATIDIQNYPRIKNIIDEDYFEKFKTDSLCETPGYTQDGNNYCLIVRWGTVGLVAKKSLKDRILADGYNVLRSTDSKKKITIFDWYLPNMGIFSLMYLNDKGINNRNPYDLSSGELEEMYNSVMKPIRPNVNSFYQELGLVIENTYKEQTDFVPGIGEWAIGNNVLSEDNSRDWYIPKQGGIIWIEALAIPTHTKNNPEKLKDIYSIIELFTSADLQAKLAWRKAYTAHVPNKKAYNLMKEEQKNILRYKEIDDILPKLYFRKVPSENTSEWINTWSKFKNDR